MKTLTLLQVSYMIMISSYKGNCIPTITVYFITFLEKEEDNKYYDNKKMVTFSVTRLRVTLGDFGSQVFLRTCSSICNRSDSWHVHYMFAKIYIVYCLNCITRFDIFPCRTNRIWVVQGWEEECMSMHPKERKEHAQLT